ncbi:MAG: hypothetical protein H6728_17790 [Myxococcales bacterium]|nr:hypothetical protein [Myxococcales bacterium]
MFRLFRTLTFAGMLLATTLFLPTPQVHANPPLGTLFVARTSFPTNAENDKDLIRKGRKHRHKNLRIAPGGDSIQCHILLVLKSKFRGNQIYFVLYPAGSKDYVAATPVSVKRGTKRLISPMTFDAIQTR